MGFCRVLRQLEEERKNLDAFVVCGNDGEAVWTLSEQRVSVFGAMDPWCYYDRLTWSIPR